MRHIVYILLAICFLTSCVKDDHPAVAAGDGDVSVYLTINTPGTSPATRSDDYNESSVIQTDVIVLQENAGSYGFVYRARATYLPASEGNKFEVKLSYSDKPLKLLVLANSTHLIPDIPLGAPEEAVRKLVVRDQPLGTTVDLPLPMSGEITLPDGLSESISRTVELVRSVARVDVRNGDTDNFRMTSVQFFRLNDKIQVVHEDLTDNVAYNASVPAGAAMSVNTSAVSVGAGLSVAGLIIPESKLPDPADRRSSSCVVVGGYYDGDTQISYYRMDFIPVDNNDLFGQVLRNHRYSFVIKEVTGQGWREPEEAANNDASQITAQVKVWNEKSVYAVFDGANFFGVSSRVVELQYVVAFSETIFLETDVEDFTAYWSDASSNPISGSNEFLQGDTSIDPQGFFRAELSPDGTQITLTTTSINNTSGPRTAYITFKAKRLRAVITVIQHELVYASRPIYFWGSTSELGTFGNDFVGSTTSSASRPAVLKSKLVNLSNFGPSGRVKFDGYRFGGTELGQITADFARTFDVIYLSYAGNPSEATVSAVLGWLEASRNRVLIVQYDNESTNQRMLSALNLSNSLKTDVQPYTVAPNAPEEILSGPFGEVARSMKFRCYDTTHGQLNSGSSGISSVTPILYDGSGGIVLGVDMERRIVYSGDIDLYYGAAAHTGQYLSSGTGVVNDADKLLLNLWAWMARVVLAD